jgi:hypothetical protein
MVNLLSAALVIGAQAVFLTEFVYTLVSSWIPRRALTSILPIIFASTSAWLLEFKSAELFVLIPAASFVALAIIKWLNSQVVVTQRGRAR